MFKQVLLVSAMALAASSIASADGLYVGAGIGASRLNDKVTNTYTSTNPIVPSKTSTGTADSIGVNGTVLAGYAWDSMDSYFVGLEAFDNGSTAKASKELVYTKGISADLSSKINNVYGVRVLPGFHLTPDMVAYGILGVAHSEVTSTQSLNDESTTSQKNSFKGYQIGLGSMKNLTPNFALRGDLIYTGYKAKTISSGTVVNNGDTYSDSFKLKPSSMEANLVAVFKFG